MAEKILLLFLLQDIYLRGIILVVCLRLSNITSFLYEPLHSQGKREMIYKMDRKQISQTKSWVMVQSLDRWTHLAKIMYLKDCLNWY